MERFHVRFADGASGEELGLLLVETPQLGFNRRLVNPYAAKGATGSTQDSDLTEWSVQSLRDWRGGRGQEELEEKTRFFDAWNLETRIRNQLTLGPLPQSPAGTYPKHEPGNVATHVLGWPKAEQSVHVSSDGDFQVDSSYRVGQRFLVWDETGGLDYQITSVEVRIRKSQSAPPVHYPPTHNIRLSIYSGTNPTNWRTPGVPDEELAYVEVAPGDVGSSFDWVTFTLASQLDVEGSRWYWIVLSCDDETEGYYFWSTISTNPYQYGFLARAVGGPAWDWRDLYPSRDAAFKVHHASNSLSQSFAAPAGGMSCERVFLYVWQQMWGFHPMTVKLCDDNDGVPGTVLKSKALGSVGRSYTWKEVEWDSAQALTGEATYHIVLEPTNEATKDWWLVGWGGDSGEGYGDGTGRRKVGSDNWAAEGTDFYFRINNEELHGSVTAFVRFNDKWYCASGDKVYEWNSENGEWDESDDQAANVSALEAWGGYLWAARGASVVLRRYNGEEWADVTGTYANLLKGGGGYLQRTDGQADHGHELYYTADGEEWSDAIAVGAGDYEITAMEWYRDQLMVATAVRLWGVTADLAYPLLDWSTQEDADNGREMVAWSRTGCLYIPLRFGLYRWNGDTMVSVGPEQGTGLPAERAGKIAAMVGTGNWLFAGIDAGADGRSSVLAYNGMGGWHELQRAERVGDRIKALGFEVLSSPNRLWFGAGNETRYLMLPDYSDNPWQWSGYEFNAGGEIEFSWMGGELLEVVKDLHEVVVRGEGITEGRPVVIYYEVDRSGLWTYLGEVTASPRDTVRFEASNFLAKTVGDDSTRMTIELASGSTTEDMEAGEWCRINGEVRQVASITDADTFVLETALSAAPLPAQAGESGDGVYASRPAGREFRLKLVLSTDDKTETPLVKAVFVRYQNNVLDRFVYSLQIRVEDGLVDLAANPYPHTAADLRAALDEWATRVTPFTLYDPDGVASTVKVTGVGEGGFVRESGAAMTRYGSVYSINLVEVA